MKWHLRFLASLLIFGCFAPAGVALAAENHLLLTGQVMLQHSLTLLDAPAYESHPAIRTIKGGLDKVFTMIRKNDAVMLELESALALEREAATPNDSGRDRDSDYFHEVTRSSIIDLIQNQLRLSKNQLLFTAANNHVSDNGEAGIRAMLDLFKEIHVPLAGIGFEAEASAPRYLSITRDEVAPQKFALIGFATDKVKLEASKTSIGVNTLSVISAGKTMVKEVDQKRIFDSLELARKNTSTVVAYQHNHHWNQQKVNVAGGVEQWRVDFARQCIEHGADVYFAHGEPRLQGIEIYRGKPIFYGLGNFVFQTRKVNFYQSEVWESVIAELEYSAPPTKNSLLPRRLKSIKLTPIALNENGVEPLFFQTRGLPAVAGKVQAESILHRLQLLSEQFGTHIKIDSDENGAIVGRITISDSW